MRQERKTVPDPTIWYVLAAGFVGVSALHVWRATRPTGSRRGARKILAAACLAWAAAAALTPRPPRGASYAAMGIGVILTVAAAVVSSREGA